MRNGKRKRDELESDLHSHAGPSTKKHRVDPTAEKRLARVRNSCPKNILDRVNRVMTQRFFMIERNRVGGTLKEEFKILGSTGNVYTVVIDKLPSCDCPDAGKGNHCKHILFVLLKVLSVPMTSTYYYQKYTTSDLPPSLLRYSGRALLSTELEAIFSNAPAAPNSSMDSRIKAAYARATGRLDELKEIESVSEKKDGGKKRIPGEGDDCPICYEEMHNVDIKKLIFCEECGNALHSECFQQWATAAKPLTCVWCRAKWPVASDNAVGSSMTTITSEGYLNLGGVAGISPVRDTSSYYHSPRRNRDLRTIARHSLT